MLGPITDISGLIETRLFNTYLFVDGVLKDSVGGVTLFDAVLRGLFCQANVSIKQLEGVIPPNPFPNSANISAFSFGVQ